MKKFFSIMCAMALVFTAGQVFAANFTVNGANPLNLELVLILQSVK